MNCKHCGAKIAVFSRYCENCGQEAHSLLEWMKIIGASTWSFLKKRLWLTASVGGALILSIVLLIILCRPNYINPMDYVVTTTKGFDGNGQISVSIDYDALCEDILGEMPDASTKKGYEKSAKYQEDAERISETLNITTDRNRNLKNGEFYIVTIHVVDQDIYEEFGFAFKSDKYQKTFQTGVDVEEFDKPVTIDLFDYITPVFTGVNGDGTLSFAPVTKDTKLTFASGKTLSVEIKCYEYWGTYRMNITIAESDSMVTMELYIDKYYKYSNGEEINVSIAQTSEDYLLKNGIVIKQYEKTFTVSGLTKSN